MGCVLLPAGGHQGKAFNFEVPVEGERGADVVAAHEGEAHTVHQAKSAPLRRAPGDRGLRQKQIVHSSYVDQRQKVVVERDGEIRSSHLMPGLIAVYDGNKGRRVYEDRLTVVH